MPLRTSSTTPSPARRPARRLAGAVTAVTAVVVAAASSLALTASSGQASAPAQRAATHWSDVAIANPASFPVTELVGQFPLPKLGATEVHLSLSRWGYRYQAGMANNRLTITEVDGGLRFVDTAARSWAKLPRTCTRLKIGRAAAAQCPIPSAFAGGMFIETWPKLGNDSVDASTLSARFRLWALTDDGSDTVRGGAGNDFINTAFMADRAWGGAGDDWIRVGTGANEIYGDAGSDRLVGGDHDDRIHGGDGDDRLGGLLGNDTLWGDAGADILVGGPGSDTAYLDATDRAREIESMRR
ncbi:calcium-binding protein [Nocardioides dongxiaopingii]|uniref:calcium-binding protein n=1 Tax=Nocardioides TaxID=1839 RepID=UPI0010C76748|nr:MULTISPECIES: calcium-binding protein [Nocardioides]QCW49814.2 calcium-binding protein [Nocardioides sp. S-1144]